MKFAEVLCKHVEEAVVVAAGGEGASAAGFCLYEHAEEAAGGAARREGASVAGLLHLLSPVPRAAPGTSAERRLRSHLSNAWDLAGDVNARVESDEFALAAAYYSLRPPAIPLQLVAVAPPAPPAHTTPRSASNSPRPACTAIVAVQLDAERSKHAVRSVLCELMPLSSPQALSTPGRCSRLPCYDRSSRRARFPWFARSHRSHTQRHARFPHARFPHTRHPRHASSASTEPPLQRASNTFHADSHNRDLAKDVNARVESDQFALAATYYSLQPPALPLQLLATPAPATPWSAFISSPPPPCTELVAVQLDEERCKKAVRSVLCELMPLTSSSTPGRCTRSPCYTSPRRARSPWFARSSNPAQLHRYGSTRPRHPRYASPTTPAPSLQRASNTFYADGHNRNLLLLDDTAPSAVSTAFAAKADCAGSAGNAGSAESAGNAGNAGSADCAGSSGSAETVKRKWSRSVASQVYARGKVQRDDCYPDEWLGGVRALRDSHVRLVLRQLRHIERLNHALDRIAYPAAPPGAARDAHVAGPPAPPALPP